MFGAYIGTTRGVFGLRDGELEPLGLDGERIMALHAWDGTVLAGSYGNGLFRSTDEGRSWSRVEAGLTASAFRFLGHVGGTLFAGTEPARIYRSGDGGVTWQELDGITRIEGHERWFLPYSPRAGAVRNVHGGNGLLLAAAEVAGLLRSEDDGRTWVCEPVDGDEDLHHITGHPDDADLLYASMGSASLADDDRHHGGIARSRDGGRTWERLETDYTRATLVPPTRPDLLLAGPARQVGRGGRIVVSADGGDTWRAAGTGIEIPMADMVELFLPAPDGSVWAMCSQGRLLRASPEDWTWSSALPPGADDNVKSVAFR